MKAKRFKHIAKATLRIIGYQAAFAVIGLLITPMFISASAAIRIPLVGFVIVAAVALMFMEASYRGESDCAKAETLNRLMQKGDYNASGRELAARFHWTNGVFSAALAALPFVLIAGYVAITATPYVYILQDLPSWLSNYTHRAEIGAPLLYAQNLPAVSTLTDYLRVAVRFLLFPYVCMLGEMSDEASLLFDRISPLLMLILPTAAMIGYQFGPARRRKTVQMIEKAKSTPRKRLKKSAKRQGPKEKKQLI